MTSMQTGLAVLCVVCISAGQTLFKYVGNEVERTGSFFSPPALVGMSFAMALYGGTTILWVHLLRRASLSSMYPYMALSFVLVPIFSRIFYGEQVSAPYFAGVALIVSGIVVLTRYG